MLGKLISQQRRERGLGQRELARLLGISPAYLCDIEKGYRFPPPETIKRIAAELQVSPDDWLFLWALETVPEDVRRIIASRNEPSI